MSGDHERPETTMRNTRADRVKAIARLSGRSARLKQQLFRVEGPQAVREALRAELQAPGTIDQLYYHPDLLRRHEDIAQLIHQLDTHRIFVRAADPEVIAAMSDAQHPQGIIALARLITHSGPPPEPKGRLAGVFCAVQDPGNLGTMIRVADAVGADAVFCSQGSVDAHNPKVVRSTVGSLFHIPVSESVMVSEVVAAHRQAGWQILAADGYGQWPLDQLQYQAFSAPDGHLDSPVDIDLQRPTLWLFGNEAQGLSDEEKELADAAVAAPLYGQAESLNVATAATLCLYASAMAQRHRAADAPQPAGEF